MARNPRILYNRRGRMAKLKKSTSHRFRKCVQIGKLVCSIRSSAFCGHLFGDSRMVVSIPHSSGLLGRFILFDKEKGNVRENL